jgi:hypothetical protein
MTNEYSFEDWVDGYRFSIPTRNNRTRNVRLQQVIAKIEIDENGDVCFKGWIRPPEFEKDDVVLVSENTQHEIGLSWITQKIETIPPVSLLVRVTDE